MFRPYHYLSENLAVSAKAACAVHEGRPVAFCASISSMGHKGVYRCHRLVVLPFITVDPERDTPEQLKRYAENFHPRLVALTGNAEEVAAAAKAYRVYYAKQQTPDVTGGYLMDHTSIIYLMGRDGRYLSHFTHTSAPDAIAAEIKKYLTGGAQS